MISKVEGWRELGANWYKTIKCNMTKSIIGLIILKGKVFENTTNISFSCPISISQNELPTNAMIIVTYKAISDPFAIPWEMDTGKFQINYNSLFKLPESTSFSVTLQSNFNILSTTYEQTSMNPSSNFGGETSTIILDSTITTPENNNVIEDLHTIEHESSSLSPSETTEFEVLTSESNPHPSTLDIDEISTTFNSTSNSLTSTGSLVFPIMFIEYCTIAPSQFPLIKSLKHF